MMLASKIALKRSENNEKQLTLELAMYFQSIEKEVQKLLQEYGHTEYLLQGQLKLILSPTQTWARQTNSWPLGAHRPLEEARVEGKMTQEAQVMNHREKFPGVGRGQCGQDGGEWYGCRPPG